MPPPGTDALGVVVVLQLAGQRATARADTARRGRAAARHARAAAAGRACRTRGSAFALRRPRARLERAPARSARACGRAIGGERLAAGVEGEAQRGHRWRASGAAQHARACWRDGSRRTARASRRRCRPRARSACACGAAPSTRSTAPLMKAAAGVSRKTIAAETSLSVPKRPQRHGLASCRAGSPPLGRVVVHAAGGDLARRDRVDAHAARPTRAPRSR